MTVEVITLGCRLNAAESETMRRLAADDDDLVTVNSCAVTAEAVRQARQAIRRAKRARPEARVVVTGCAAQIEPQTFAAMPEGSRVVGNADKFNPASFTGKALALRGEGWVKGYGVGEFPPSQSPLTPTLSPPGRGGLAGADDEDGGHFGSASHHCWFPVS